MSKPRFIVSVSIGALITMATAWAMQVRQADIESPAADAAATASVPANGSDRFAVVIREPQAPAGVETGQLDRLGQPIRLACRSCHDVLPANVRNAATADLDTFHQGLAVQHGKLACVACHNQHDGYTTLHLADGSSVAYADTMALCAQCHGTQHRDYQHGTHGGMSGYWDLSRGPRQRNHCIDCHDPHTPAFPKMYPAEGPNDRFQPAAQESVH
ncbi:MAG: cytochrome c3 family protein [Fuerstiella sp.]